MIQNGLMQYTMKQYFGKVQRKCYQQLTSVRGASMPSVTRTESLNGTQVPLLHEAIADSFHLQPLEELVLTLYSGIDVCSACSSGIWLPGIRLCGVNSEGPEAHRDPHSTQGAIEPWGFDHRPMDNLMYTLDKYQGSISKALAEFFVCHAGV